jgi:hypothetical protein
MIFNIWEILKSEWKEKSAKSDGLGSDTLRTWLVAIILMVVLYLCVYYFPYPLPLPLPRKIAWHRLCAGIISGAGIIGGTVSYSIHLWRRLKARKSESNGT